MQRLSPELAVRGSYISLLVILEHMLWLTAEGALGPDGTIIFHAAAESEIVTRQFGKLAIGRMYVTFVFFDRYVSLRA